MYEKLKNDVIRKLYGKLSVEDIHEVCKALDLCAVKYTVTASETHLAVMNESGLELAKTYSASRVVEGHSKGSIRNSMYHLKNFFDSVMLPPSEVKANDVRSFLYHYKADRSITDASLDKVRQDISAFFKWAYENEYIDKNPCCQVKKIKCETKQRHYLNQMELEKLRDACKSNRDKLIVELLYSTGCRASEAVNIKIADIDWVKNEVVVTGKGKKQRTVYLNAKSLNAIRRYLDERDDDCPFLIASVRNPKSGLQYGAVEKIVRKIAGRACMECRKVTPHILRHTCATTMLQNGGNITSVQKVLGHASISTTMIYAEIDNIKVSDEHRRTVI